MTAVFQLATAALLLSQSPAPVQPDAGAARPTPVLVSGQATARYVAPGSADYNRADVFSTTDPSSKVICKRETLTGSLLATYRVCMTKGDWDAKSANAGHVVASWQVEADSYGIAPP